MSELKACPFCGKEGCFVDKDGNITESGLDVACERTSCMPPSSYVPVDSWQSRPLEDALTARIAELEGALKKIAYIIQAWENEGDFDDDALLKIAQEVLK